jgi:hypothetical protein
VGWSTSSCFSDIVVVGSGDVGGVPTVADDNDDGVVEDVKLFVVDSFFTFVDAAKDVEICVVSCSDDAFRFPNRIFLVVVEKKCVTTVRIPFLSVEFSIRFFPTFLVATAAVGSSSSP